MNRSLAWPLILIASTVLVGILIGMDSVAPYRFPITFAYLLICPGMAYVRLLNLSRRSMEWVLAIAASISIELLLSEIMVLTKLWSPKAAFFAIGLFCVAGALVQVIFPRQKLAERQPNR